MSVWSGAPPGPRDRLPRATSVPAAAPRRCRTIQRPAVDKLHGEIGLDARVGLGLERGQHSGVEGIAGAGRARHLGGSLTEIDLDQWIFGYGYLITC